MSPRPIKILCAFVALLATIPAGFASDPRPNIVTIMVDDMGYSDLGCYGSEIKTPTLDKLAAGGIRFTQMYNTSKCWTTRISLLSGLYHQRSGRGFERTALAGEVLRPAGYHTWWSGKHHADFNPHGRGFDHFSGFLGGAINFWNPGQDAREGEPPPGWRAVYTWAFDDKLVKPFVPDKKFYATDSFTDWALTWLDDAKRNESDGIEKPFFLYLAYNAPHWPLHAHPEDIAKYKGSYDGGYEAIRKARYQRQVAMGLHDPLCAPLSEPEAKLDEWSQMSDESRQMESKRMAVHAAMVDRVDQNVGRLIEKLEALGELENTLILFLVDNGASAESPNRKGAPPEPWGSVGTFESIGSKWANAANTPLRFWKVTSHEGGINTPMIAHWPKGISEKMRGKFYRKPCHLIDLLPTWMELAGERASYPGESKQQAVPPIDGISITPAFAGKPLARNKPLFFQYGSGKAIRDGDWKLVRRGSAPWELHNLKTGRTEASDLASSEPQRVEAMEAAWKSWYQSCTGQAFKEKPKKAKKPKKTKTKTKQ
ncbi:MAG: arylsulfatase A-like enzyme [Pseudoalteromonas tetraodonis]|jgi:arylsulfatase A-like enzyme